MRSRPCSFAAAAEPLSSQASEVKFVDEELVGWLISGSIRRTGSYGIRPRGKERGWTADVRPRDRGVDGIG